MAAVRYYKMRARDAACGSLTYRTWVVPEVPDTTGDRYEGTWCGSPDPKDFADITIASTWVVVEEDRWIAPVRAATTEALPACTWTLATQSLEADANGVIPTIDTSVDMVVGDRLLVKNQVDAEYNGVYDVVVTGIPGVSKWKLTRSEDQNSSAQVVCGVTCQIEEGTDNGNKSFRISTVNPITLNTTELAWVVQGGAPPAKVTTTTEGVVNEMGTVANKVFCTDGAESGGVWRDFLAIGGITVAGSGTVRLPVPASWSFKALNQAGDTDWTFLDTTTSNDVVLGGGVWPIVTLSALTEARVKIGGTTRLDVTATKIDIPRGVGNTAPLADHTLVMGSGGQGLFHGEFAQARAGASAQVGQLPLAVQTLDATQTPLFPDDANLEWLTPPERSQMVVELLVTAQKDLSGGGSAGGAGWHLLCTVARGEMEAAVGTITGTANFVTTETVTIDATVYTFVSPFVDAAFNVAVGADLAESMENLYAAINLETGAGTKYGTATTEHPTVEASDLWTDYVEVEAKTAGAAGNLIATTTTAANATWGGTELSGGDSATPTVNTVKTVIYKSDSAWDVNLTGASDQGYFWVLVTGKAATKINWVARMSYSLTMWTPR